MQLMNYNYGPLIKNKFDEIKKESVDWKLIWNGENGCEVKKGRKQYVVNKEHKACCCRSWQLFGIPCPHACCAIWHLEKDSDDYLHRYYQKDTHLKAYSYSLQPINESHEWAKSGIEPVLPPVEKIMPGKPKKNRRKANNEPKKVKPGHLSSVGLIMRCKNYGGEGHNKRSCKQDPNTTGTQSGTSTRSTTQKKNDKTPPCIQANTTGSQSGTSMRTRSQKRMAFQEPISTQESTTTKKLKK